MCVLPFVVTLTHIQCPRSLPFLRLCVLHLASSQAGAAVELALDIDIFLIGEGVKIGLGANVAVAAAIEVDIPVDAPLGWVFSFWVCQLRALINIRHQLRFRDRCCCSWVSFFNNSCAHEQMTVDIIPFLQRPHRFYADSNVFLSSYIVFKLFSLLVWEIST